MAVPPERDHRESAPVMYTLYRIEDDQTTTHIEDYPTIEAGVTAGVDMVERVDLDHAYTLNSSNGRVVSFREGRVGLRAWMQRTGRLSPSVEDRYDHDVDELMM